MATAARKGVKKADAKKSAKKAKAKRLGARAAPEAKKKTPPQTSKPRDVKPAKVAKSPPASAAKILTCSLNHGRGNDAVKLTWKLDDKEVAAGTFSVSTAAIRDYATKIRAALARLEAISAPFKPSVSEHVDALRNLAKNGEALATLAIGGGEANVGSSPAFYKWFMSKVARAKPGEFEILFIHWNLNTIDGRVFVAPWHLAFTPGANIDQLAPTPEGFGRFWCLQYRMVAVTQRYRDIVAMDPLLPNETRISAVLEVGQDRVRSVEQRIHERKKDRASSGGVLRPSELVEASDERSTSHRFNYIWLHPSGDGPLGLEHEFVQYAYANDDYLDKERIRASANVVEQDKFMMTMFDGDCIMRDRTSWIEPLMNRLRGGLIAPETDIRLESQRLFGWHFLKTMIVHARSLSEAIAYARAHRDHWPRSLIYGFYCNARHVYVEKKPEAALHGLFKEIDNFIKNTGGNGQ